MSPKMTAFSGQLAQNALCLPEDLKGEEGMGRVKCALCVIVSQAEISGLLNGSILFYLLVICDNIWSVYSNSILPSLHMLPDLYADYGNQHSN